MGMHEGRARLGKSMRQLMARWAATRMQWNDANAENFETQHLAPLEADLRLALTAMDQMSQILQQIKKDCE
ncbi:MAG: hypothetical protein ABSG31_00235 [Tepidisphaeraceae bacterium]|jgi:hypothetical protein